MEEIKRFKVGETYFARSTCDHDCIFSYTILKRTAKQITFIKRGKPVTRGVYIIGNQEECKPEGTYSMCPVIRA